MSRRTLAGAFRLGVLLILLVPSASFAQDLTATERAKLPPAWRTGSLVQAFSPAAAHTGALALAGEADGQRMPVVIRTNDAAAVRALGIRVNSEFPGFVTAMLTPDDAAALAASDAVQRIELGVTDSPSLDLSVPATGAHLLHGGFINDTPFRGEGALVMIVDTGIDFRHPDFLDPDTGESRIYRIWDQTRLGVAPSGFTYGVEYTQEKLNDALAGLANPATEDTQGHGTHVAGIAVGNGNADGRLSGMAPDADIVIVKTRFNSVNFIDALTYADRLATDTGRPIVVNYSAGGHAGAHDGSAAHEVAIDAFMAKPGRVVVTSAGNDGDERLHSGGTVAAGSDASVRISIPTYSASAGTQNDYALMNFYYESDDPVTVSLRSPSGLTTSVGLGETANASAETDGQVYLANEVYNGNLKQVVVQIFDATVTLPPKNGTWVLTFSDATADIRYDGWLYAETIGAGFAITSSDTEQTISMPGTSHSVITVGAHVTKNRWWAADGKTYSYSATTRIEALAGFSSIGPTRDGRVKPDLTAPGVGVFSARSTDYDPSTSGTHTSTQHYVTQGTSMSSPHVAGAVALLLGAEPTMTGDEVRAALFAGVRPAGIAPPNMEWGYGKLDIFRAFVHAFAPGTDASRRWFDFFDANGTSSVSAAADAAVAVRVSPSETGRLTGLRMMVGGFTGSGDVEISLHADAGGQPGAAIGAPVRFPSAHLDATTFVDLTSRTFDVDAGSDYFVVLSAPSGALTLDADSNLGPERTFTNAGGTWQAHGGEAFVAFELSHMGATAIDNEDNAVALADGYALSSAYPNPFTEAAHVSLTLERPAGVRAEVFDVLGRRVAVLYDGPLAAGRPHLLRLEGADLPPGLYLLRVIGTDFQQTRTLTRLR